MTTEFRVRPVTRYNVTLFTDDGESQKSMSCGEFGNSEQAHYVANALHMSMPESEYRSEEAVKYDAKKLLNVTKQEYDECITSPFDRPDEAPFHLDSLLVAFETLCNQCGEDFTKWPAHEAAVAYQTESAKWEEEHGEIFYCDPKFPMARIANASIGNKPLPYGIDKVVTLHKLV